MSECKKELNVKIGDKVLLVSENSRRIVTVKKITPTGRIKVTNCTFGFDKYGEKMGGNDLYKNIDVNIQPLTKEVEREFHLKSERMRLIYLINANLENASLDTLKEISSLLEGNNKKEEN